MMLNRSKLGSVVVLMSLVGSLILLIGCSRSHSSIELPQTASEDVSHILVVPKAAEGEYDFDAPRDYLPDELVEWVATFELTCRIF